MWVPAEGGAGAGAGCGLVGGEHRAERPEGLLRHCRDRQAQAPPDGLRDVAYGVALVGHRVPGAPGGCPLRGEAEQGGGIKGVHGRPALGAVPWVSGGTGATGDIGEQSGDPPGCRDGRCAAGLFLLYCGGYVQMRSSLSTRVSGIVPSPGGCCLCRPRSWPSLLRPSRRRQACFPAACPGEEIHEETGQASSRLTSTTDSSQGGQAVLPAPAMSITVLRCATAAAIGRIQGDARVMVCPSTPASTLGDQPIRMRPALAWAAGRLPDPAKVACARSWSPAARRATLRTPTACWPGWSWSTPAAAAPKSGRTSGPQPPATTE